MQIAFDARGRLWVVTMPSFPHTVPGQPQEDKIIVLEDTDHDGKADQCTTFAQGLDALDGNAFQMYGDGVVLDGLALTWTPLGVYHPFNHANLLGYGKGVAAVRFDFRNGPIGYNLYREIALTGTPTP